jgi:hypothetical protein
MLRNRNCRGSLPKRSFVERVSWPVERSSVNALCDLGLTVEQIARYFSVDPIEVRTFLESGP